MSRNCNILQRRCIKRQLRPVQDNDQILIGTGDDLKIYHSGTNFHISNSTGTLFTLSDTFEVKGGDGNETHLKTTNNGSVELYYDNIKRFETTTAGIEVTGHSELDNVNAAGITTTQTLHVGTAGTTLTVDPESSTFAIGSASVPVTATMNGGAIPSIGLVIARRLINTFYHIKNNGRIFFKQTNTRKLGSITTKTGSTVVAGSTVITNASVTGIGASNLIVNSNYIAGTKVHSVTAVSGGIGTVYADRASTNTASATNQTVNFLGVTTAFTASATEKSILIGEHLLIIPIIRLL